MRSERGARPARSGRASSRSSSRRTACAIACSVAIGSPRASISRSAGATARGSIALRVVPRREQPGALALVAEAVAHDRGRQGGEIAQAADAEPLEHESAGRCRCPRRPRPPGPSAATGRSARKAVACGGGDDERLARPRAAGRVRRQEPPRRGAQARAQARLPQRGLGARARARRRARSRAARAGGRRAARGRRRPARRPLRCPPARCTADRRAGAPRAGRGARAAAPGRGRGPGAVRMPGRTPAAAAAGLTSPMGPAPPSSGASASGAPAIGTPCSCAATARSNRGM